MGLPNESSARPGQPPPGPREGWRGVIAILASLLGLAACIVLASAINLADLLPSTLTQYQPTTIGQASLYRVEYSGGGVGYATLNVVKPSTDAIAYVDTYAPGHTIQLHTTFTNWLGTGALHSRDEYYSRNGERLAEVGQLEAGLTILFTPAVDAWSPELLASSPVRPVRASPTINGVRFDYRAWRDANEKYPLPGGGTRLAVRLEADLIYSGTLLTHSESWYAAGVGLVRSRVTNGQGQLVQNQDLLASTALAGSANAAALPLADLLSGAGDAVGLFREDAARTGAHGDAQIAPAGLRVTYRLQTGADTLASPVFAGGLFYLADSGGQLSAIDSGQGVPRWRFSAGGPIVAAPAVAGGQVYFGAADKTLYALDAQRGMYLWSYRLKDNVASSPVVADGVIYVGGEDRTLYALDARTGQLHWSQTTGDRLVSSPAVSDGRVIIGSDDGVLYAFEAVTGRELWRYAMDGAIEATPSVSADGIVYAASNGQEMAAVRAATGKEVWTASGRFGYLASPAVEPGRVYAASTDGLLHAYDAHSGLSLWTARDPKAGAFVGSPLAVGGAVVAVDTDGLLTVWDGASGALLRQLDLGGSVVGSPTWTGAGVLVTTANGDLILAQSDPNLRGLALTTQWRQEFGGANPDPRVSAVYAQPIWLNDRPIVVLRGGGLWSLDPKTGNSRPIGEVGEPVSANAILSGSVLYLGTDQGHLVAYDLANGRPLWKTAVGTVVRFAPAVGDTAVFVDGLTATQSVVTAVDPTTGNALWSHAFSDGTSTPALADGRLYVAGEAITALNPATGDVVWKSDPFLALGCLASFQGVVYAGRGQGAGASFVALDGASGKLLWSRADPVHFAYSRPAFDGASQTVLGGATDGELFAYDARTGALRWRFWADSPIQSDPQVQAGVVYVTAASGNLYALEIATGRLLTNYRPGSPIETHTAPLVRPDRVFTAQGFGLFALTLETNGP